MYDFKDFISNAKDRLEAKYPELEITVKDIVKNNDVILKAFQISNADNNVAPTIYLDSFYSRYKAGEDMDSVLNLLSQSYETSLNNVDIDESKINDVSNYFIKVVNKDANRRYLENTPYMEYEDLALTLRCLVVKENKDIASAKVSNALLDNIGLEKEEVFRIAKENTIRLFPPVTYKMSDIINQSFSVDYNTPDLGMYVLSNDCGVNGDTVMIYDDYINDFIKEHGECYMIPSSIHEVIMIPKKEFDGDAAMLKMFVSEVNKTAVQKVDFLSDNIYIANENGISLVEGLEKEDYMEM